jgi:hypothetical protein
MPPPKDETAEQREARLIKARKKASNVREEKMIEKYKSKVLEKVKTEKEENGNENENEDEDNESENENENENVKPMKEIIPKKITEKEITPKEPKESKSKKKEMKMKMKSKVIIEQSSDDDDVFEDKSNVIFVKRVRPKPKEPQLVQQPNQQPQSVQQQQQLQQSQQQRPPPPPPQRPALTPEKRLHMQQYINMTQGHFLPVCRPR